MNVKQTIAFGLTAVVLAACTPTDQPVDLVKTQRDGLNKAKALEGQMQQQAADRAKAAEEAQK